MALARENTSFYTISIIKEFLYEKNIFCFAFIFTASLAVAQKGVLLPDYQEEKEVQVQNLDQLNTALEQSNQNFKLWWNPTASGAYNDELFSNIQKEVRKNESPAKKPWQVLVAMGARKDPANESITHRAIIKALRQGHIMRGVITAVQPLKKGEDSSVLYVYTIKNGRIYREQYTIARNVAPKDLIDALFGFISTSPTKDFYTAVIFSFHGDRQGMTVKNYKQDDNILIKDIISATEKYNVFIDVLDLMSCEVDSLYNMLPVIKSNRVDYVLTSSNIALTRSIFAPALLNFMNYAPQQAAKEALEQEQKNQKLDFVTTLQDKITPFETFNLVLLSMPELRKPILDWLPLMREVGPFLNFEDSFALVKITKDDKTIYAPVTTSLYTTTKKMDEMVRGNSSIPQDLKSRFLQANNLLKAKIHPTHIPQWCFSKNNHILPPSNTR